eukprot:Sspe_Gene.71970::Locus_42792_Transcript_1_1_Confidence_1.000_Length_563::g.71970::m.71970/K06875/PDCD5, TFAR19; programmed cell death protein 5
MEQVPKQMSAEEQQAQAQKQMEMEEQRDTMLRGILDAEARERIKRISCVKPDKARNIENYLIQAVRQGRMQPPISDSALRNVLEAVSEQGGSAQGPKITFARKTRDDDDW